MSLTFFSLQTKETHLCIDLGSASVGVAIVVYKENTYPTIVSSVRIPLSVHKPITNEAFLSTLLEYLTIALETTLEQGVHALERIHAPQNIQNVHVTCSSPWFVTGIHNAKETFDEPQFFTEEYFNTVLQTAEEGFYEIASNAFTDTPFNSDVRILEHEYSTILLNGYATNNPFGKQITEYTMDIFFSAIPAILPDRIENIISDFFHFKKIYFHTTTHSIHTTIGTLFPRIQNGFTIEISGEQTDITLIKNGHLRHVYSCEQGINTLVRSVAKQRNIGYKAAESALETMTMEDVLHDHREEIKAAIVDAINAWKVDITNILKLIQQEYMWCPRAYVVTPHLAKDMYISSLSDLFSDYVKDKNVSSVQVINISPKLLSHFCRITDESMLDIRTTINALFVAQYEGYSYPSTFQADTELI